MSEESQSYGLVMPFLSVASKGGPHDDESYVCGYEMGGLDQYLDNVSPDRHELTIHASNQGQADLIAMRHGYKATFRDLAAEHSGWIDVLFERTEAP